MNAGRPLFAQVMDFVPWTSFYRIVEKYGGDVRVRSLRCTEQFRTMAFAQMTYRESLRDIEACLRARPSKLYGMGLRGAVAKSTLANANELRDWRMWSDLAAVLIRRARKLYATQDFGIDLASAFGSKAARARAENSFMTFGAPARSSFTAADISVVIPSQFLFMVSLFSSRA